MSETTAIEWTDSTWSPIRVRVKQDAAAIARAEGYASLVPIAEKMAGRLGQHCEHVSPGCEHCYAETNNHRCLPANGTGLPYDRRSRDLVEAFVDERALMQPFHWRWIRAANSSTVRNRRIFVENQSDMFGEWISDDLLDRVFAVMALCPEHVFQVLTKRPERMLEYFHVRAKFETRTAFIGAQAGPIHLERTGDPVFEWSGLPLANVWLGVSVENQAAADARIPLLLETPAAVRFLSCEPLLGPVDLAGITETEDGVRWSRTCLEAGDIWRSEYGEVSDGPAFENGIDWVIAGGESGPGARPMHPDWARSLRDQCRLAGVPFFFKQWGEWAEVDGGAPNRVFDVDKAHCPIDCKNSVISLDGHVPRDQGEMREKVPYRWVSRVGKKAAGALLDGREWREFPGGRREG